MSSSIPRCFLSVFYMAIGAIALCLLLCCSACAQAGSSSENVKVPASVESTEALLRYDFTSDLDNQILVDVRGASDRVDAIIGVKALAAVSRHPKDETIMGIKRLPGDNWWALVNTNMLITQYITKHGDLPENGIDLFQDLSIENAYSDFAALYPTERLVRYGAAVNMATNRFYSDFSNPDWRPGGIYLELLEPLGDGNFQQGDEVVHFGTQDEPCDVKKAYYIKVFSAEDGYMLFDDYVTLDFSCNN